MNRAVAEDAAAAGDPDEYLAVSIGKLIDEAMTAIEFGESRPERRPAQGLAFDR